MVLGSLSLLTGAASAATVTRGSAMGFAPSEFLRHPVSRKAREVYEGIVPQQSRAYEIRRLDPQVFSGAG